MFLLHCQRERLDSEDNEPHPWSPEQEEVKVHTEEVKVHREEVKVEVKEESPMSPLELGNFLSSPPPPPFSKTLNPFSTRPHQNVF